ncbi:MAG: endonuclease/exonuclease/phosphatase family protein [bacterium]
MKLICLNIELNKHRDKVLNFLKKENPDVICLQELLEGDFEFFQKELGMQGVFKLWYFLNIPNRPEVFGQKHGVAIFAKKIIDSGFIYFDGSEENIKKAFDEFFSDKNIQDNSVFVWIETVTEKGEKFKFINTHLPVTEKGETTDYQLEVIEKLLRELLKIPEFILCGDTNAPRGKEAFTLLANKYKDNIPEKYKTSLDQNLHRVKGLQYMVDGLFTTPGYKAENVKLIDGVSDHMAIVADIEKS